jgi:undecaprenyl-diphosphatase
MLSIDHALFTWINTSHAPWLDTVMLAGSHVGVGGFLWLVIAGIAFVFPERRASAWRVVLAVGLASSIVDGVVKPLIWRDRPYIALALAHAGGVKENADRDVRVIDAKPRSSSFPSGHAANAMAGAAALSQLLPGVRIVWWTLAATIAVSRIYLGVHFPFDVLSGALLGLLCARLVLGGVKPQHASFVIGPVPGTSGP